MKKDNLKASKQKPRSRKKILLTIICIFLGIVLVFGIALGIVIGVKNAKAVVYLDGSTLDEGEANFFATYYKYRFLTEYASKGARDDEDFWNSKFDEKTTYGELFRQGTLEYLKSVLVMEYLFDSYSSLTDEDERKIEKAVAEVLDYKAEGSEERFNEMAAGYGFDFDSFKSAAEIFYKANESFERIYGKGGSNMKYFDEECKSFFETYSHVKLLFIRTNDRFILDENGNRIPDDDGNDSKEALTDKEKAARQQLISEIRASIQAYREDSDTVAQMSPGHFDNLLYLHDEGDRTKHNSGYYFSESSSYSREFASAYPEIVKKSLEMEKNSYAELEYDGGVCFIYKCENKEEDFNTLEDGFFTDFYALAAASSFSDAVAELTKAVEVKDKFDGIDLFALDYNYNLIPRF